MNEALPVKGVKVDGATVKDLKEYLANYKDDDPICVIGAYREGELQTRRQSGILRFCWTRQDSRNGWRARSTHR